MTERDGRTRAGIIMGLTAYAFWGVMPLYFKAMRHVPATEIVGSSGRSSCSPGSPRR
jgi:chloramphenicol-sensitive protein RarD